MKKLIKAFALTIMACFMVLLVLGFIEYRSVIREMPIQDKVASIMQKDDYVPIDEISDYLKVATISTEDKRFYKHQGVDLIAYGRILYVFITSGQISGGGSTITQQLAKNMYFSQEKTFLRKVAELFVAFELEKNYTKDEILELYVNTIYFGSGYYCVHDAAQGYFEKEPEQMNDYESTLLAGIPNAPSIYALTNRPELAIQRQRTVVECMVDQKYLTREEADRILQEGEQIQQAGQNNE